MINHTVVRADHMTVKYKKGQDESSSVITTVFCQTHHYEQS